MYDKKIYNKKYNEEHPEYNREYYIKNREKILKQVNQYRKNNLKLIKEKKRIYRKNNPEKMKMKDKKWRERNPDYREDNKDMINNTQRKHENKKKEYIQDYKLSKGCSVCGYNKCAGALCFHHNGEKKYKMNQYSRSTEILKKEMEGCTLLCMNCHMELHEKYRKNIKEVIK